MYIVILDCMYIEQIQEIMTTLLIFQTFKQINSQ